jgi:hypothetical protein
MREAMASALNIECYACDGVRLRSEERKRSRCLYRRVLQPIFRVSPVRLRSPLDDRMAVSVTSSSRMVTYSKIKLESLKHPGRY